MISFSQYIVEAFDKPYRFNMKKYGDDYVASFTTDAGDTIDVNFEKFTKSKDEESWGVDFSRNGSQLVTGEGDAMRIFATVIEVIKDFVKKEKPQKLSFSAEKPAWRMFLHHKDPNRSTEMGSREKLYKKLVQRYAGKMGYKYSTQSDYSATDFTLVRKK